MEDIDLDFVEYFEYFIGIVIFLVLVIVVP
jgi:hypothetical protein